MKNKMMTKKQMDKRDVRMFKTFYVRFQNIEQIIIIKIYIKNTNIY